MTNPVSGEGPGNAAVEATKPSAAGRQAGHGSDRGHRPTDPKDKVPVLEKVMYGLGSGSFQLSTDGVKGLANSVFNVTLHVPPSWIGFVQMAYRFFDALTDPLMGKISDNFRSRFGRRRPFIFVGSFLTALAFILIWRVPEQWSPTNIMIYYMLSLFFFDICCTIQTVPYHTLGLEMTADYHERTVISGYKMIFSFAFTMLLPWVFRIAQSGHFKNTMSGVRFLSYFVAFMVVVGGVLPALFVKERYYHIAKNQARMGFWRGVKLTFSNRPFQMLTGVLLLGGIGGGMVGIFGMYIIYYYICGGNTVDGSQWDAIRANTSQIAAIICIPLMTLLSKRVGKVRTLKALIVLGIAGSLGTLIFYNQSLPGLLLVSALMSAPLAAGYWTITNSMKADICDDDELRHGLRREGMFGSIGNWVIKTAMACTVFLAGIMLELTGFDVALKGAQAPETLWTMRILYAVVPASFSTAALILLHFYPLNERRMGDIRAALEARRSQVA